MYVCSNFALKGNGTPFFIFSTSLPVTLVTVVRHFSEQAANADVSMTYDSRCVKNGVTTALPVRHRDSTIRSNRSEGRSCRSRIWSARRPVFLAERVRREVPPPFSLRLCRDTCSVGAVIPERLSRRRSARSNRARLAIPTVERRRKWTPPDYQSGQPSCRSCD